MQVFPSFAACKFCHFYLRLLWLSIQFFQKLGLTKFHLIGQSMGSVYSSHYAARHPDIVQSLTMVCPPGEMILFF